MTTTTTTINNIVIVSPAPPSLSVYVHFTMPAWVEQIIMVVDQFLFEIAAFLERLTSNVVFTHSVFR